MLRSAVYAPERIGKAVFFIPSGLVSIPFSTLVYLLGWLRLFRLAPMPERLKRILVADVQNRISTVYISN